MFNLYVLITRKGQQATSLLLGRVNHFENFYSRNFFPPVIFEIPYFYREEHLDNLHTPRGKVKTLQCTRMHIFVHWRSKGALICCLSTLRSRFVLLFKQHFLIKPLRFGTTCQHGSRNYLVIRRKVIILSSK